MIWKLQIADVIAAIEAYWLPIRQQSQKNHTPLTALKLALSLAVWRQKHLHRVNFFQPVSEGTPADCVRLFQILKDMHICQDRCAEEARQRIGDLQDIVTWIVRNGELSAALPDLGERADGLDDCYRTIAALAQIFAGSHPEQLQLASDYRSTLLREDQKITAEISEKFADLIKSPTSRKEEFFAAFSARARTLPCTHLTFILERALDTHPRLDTAINNSNRCHSVFESMPYSAFQELVTHPLFSHKESFLDVGSGTGTFVIAAFLASHANIAGVEINSALVKIATQAAQKLSLDLKFFAADAACFSLAGYENIILFSTVLGEPLQVLKQNIKNTPSIKRVWTVGLVSSQMDDLNWEWVSPLSEGEHAVQVFVRREQ